MKHALHLKGLFVATTTPFVGDRFDRDAASRHLEHLIENGVDGIVTCGTTGEAATLTPQERKAVIKHSVQTAAGRVPVVAGVGTNCTAETIRLAGDALDAGADALLVVTPYYNKPPQAGLLLHYGAVADATGAPIVVYNVPSRTAVSIEPETMAELSWRDEIVAVKEATGNIRFGADMIAACQDRIEVLSGDDFSVLGLMAVGGVGNISVVGNVAPSHTARLVHAALEGDYEQARALHHQLLPLIHDLFALSNPIPVKQALALLGFGGADVRLPLSPADSELSSRLAERLRSLELL